MKNTAFGVCAFTLVACRDASLVRPSTDIEPTKEPEAVVVLPAASVQAIPYPTYCYQRVGQIGGEPRRGAVCDAHGGGAGGRMEGLARPARNSALIHIAAPSLEAVGVKSVSFSLNRGSGAPKFTKGVHVMDQVRLTDEEMDPLDLPDRIAHVSDITGKNSMFSWTIPDAAILRARALDFDFTGYEIASAVLIIDRAVDLSSDEAVAMAKAFGMITGEQYIEGTLSVSLIPMGSKGSQLGPVTFEFGETIGWGYNEALYGGK